MMTVFESSKNFGELSMIIEIAAKGKREEEKFRHYFISPCSASGKNGLKEIHASQRVTSELLHLSDIGSEVHASNRVRGNYRSRATRFLLTIIIYPI